MLTEYSHVVQASTMEEARELLIPRGAQGVERVGRYECMRGQCHLDSAWAMPIMDVINNRGKEQ
jgi:hypothetical protein